jgi:hypothetical protein
MKNVLILGRERAAVEEVQAQVQSRELQLFGGTGIDDVRKTFAANTIDAVIMGAGIDLDTRIQIVREVFCLSSSTTVHMKDVASGREGFLPFVRMTLHGMLDSAR